MTGMTELLFWWLGQIPRDPRVMMVMNRLTWTRLAMAVLLLFAATVSVQAAEVSWVARGGMEQMSDTRVRQLLLQHFARWEGVPYEYGGYDRHGVDCSGFVNLTYKQVLGLDIPRSTELLAQTGRHVARNRLAIGDILVFRISATVLHVGIYVGRGQFIHASKTRGVMLSELDSPYWSDVYLKAVRVLHYDSTI